MKPKQAGSSPLIAEAARQLNAGQLAAAATTAQRALSIKPSDVDALNILGVIEARQGHMEAAIGLLRRVVALRPKVADGHFNLARALHQARDFAEAEKYYREALRLHPSSAQFHNSLGALFQDQGDFTQARESFKRAIAADPASEIAAINFYGASRMLGAMDDVEHQTQIALKRWPQNPLHWLYRAEALFALGRLAEAWDCYAWRFKSPQRPTISRAIAGLKEWQGEDLAGRSVLVWTEQGPGDEAMYATLLPDIRAMAGDLSILCSARMASLFRRTFPGVKIYAESVPGEVVASIDVQASLVAFAKKLRPDLSTFPVHSPRLSADPVKTQALRTKYRGESKKLLIGIAWRSKDVQDAAQKSVNLGVWGPIFALPGVQFVNLQYGDCVRERAAVKSEYGADVIHDAEIDPLKDLDSYAAQIAAMDMVVSSSNTAAHLAGALGVPVHCMVPATAGVGRRWYWFERDKASVWYDSLRLWAQTSPGVWDDVVRDVTLEMAKTLASHGLKQEIAGFFERLAGAYRQTGERNHLAAVFNAWASVPGQEARGHFEMGHLAKSENRIADALDCFNRALEFNPAFAPALNMKGVVLADQGRYDEAEPFYRHAIEAAPAMYEAFNNLATAIRRMGRGTEAAELYAKANALKSDMPGILQNLATNLSEIGQPEASIPYFDQLLRLKPDYAEGHYGRGFALLTAGRLAEGWPELWWRRRLELKDGERQSSLFSLENQLPRWQGQDVAGKRVLVWAEHGLGDQIMTFSIVPDVVAAGAKVSLICDPRLVGLFRRSFLEVTVFDETTWNPELIGEFAYQLSLAELGVGFRPSIDRFPARRSFLVADKHKCNALREKYGGSPERKLIGLSWASRNPDIGGLKGLDLTQIVRSLTDVKAQLVSLQYGGFAADIADARQATGRDMLLDADIDPVRDLDVFAAQVAAMDAVVTISNTTAHMAGALGVPTLLLLPRSRGRHWYWLRALDHCPWYPSVRYCLQGSDGSWGPALSACSAALAGLI